MGTLNSITHAIWKGFLRNKILLTLLSFIHFKTNRRQVKQQQVYHKCVTSTETSVSLSSFTSSQSAKILIELSTGFYFSLLEAASKLLKPLCGCWKHSMDVSAEHWIKRMNHLFHSLTGEWMPHLNANPNANACGSGCMKWGLSGTPMSNNGSN